MKRWLVSLVVSALLLFGSLGAAAADFRAQVSADYMFGTLKSFWAEDADLNGFVVQAIVPVSGPFGVSGCFAGLAAKDVDEGDYLSDVDVSDAGVYGTFSVPVGGGLVTALAGYGQASFAPDAWSVKDTFKGFRVGVCGTYQPTDKLTVDGTAILGLGTKWEKYEDDDGLDASAYQLRLGAAYQVTSSVAVEAGYAYAKAGEADDIDDGYTVDGLFVGARARF